MWWAMSLVGSSALHISSSNPSTTSNLQRSLWSSTTTHSLISFFFFFFSFTTTSFYLQSETPSLSCFPNTSHSLLLSLLHVLPGIPFNLSASYMYRFRDGLLYSRAYWVIESVISWNVDVGNDCCYLFASKGAALSFLDYGIEGQDVKVKLEEDNYGLPAKVTPMVYL
nr:uncharacterized protein LOC125421665 [Ziziphus jujuba var. spinosa]